MTKLGHHRWLLILPVFVWSIDAAGQRPNSSANGQRLPKEVRDYKVERAQVEVKRARNPRNERVEDPEIPLRLGEALLVRVSPLGVTFDVPVIVAAVKQEGDVEQLVFEDIRVNDMPVTVDDYLHPFALPNRQPLTLAPPLRVFVSTPRALLSTIDELLNSREVWPVTGRVYVCGRFKKFLMKFKRAIPIELRASINNPLRN
jgi:hypothetical protein